MKPFVHCKYSTRFVVTVTFVIAKLRLLVQSELESVGQSLAAEERMTMTTLLVIWRVM